MQKTLKTISAYTESTDLIIKAFKIISLLALSLKLSLSSLSFRKYINYLYLQLTKLIQGLPVTIQSIIAWLSSSPLEAVPYPWPGVSASSSAHQTGQTSQKLNTLFLKISFSHS
jgi:hypothetical protein